MVTERVITLPTEPTEGEIVKSHPLFSFINIGQRGRKYFNTSLGKFQYFYKLSIFCLSSLNSFLLKHFLGMVRYDLARPVARLFCGGGQIGQIWGPFMITRGLSCDRVEFGHFGGGSDDPPDPPLATGLLASTVYVPIVRPNRGSNL